MGNLLACQAGIGAVKHAKVLLPDGNVVLLDTPMSVAEMMIEHPNHMVVHCANADPRELRNRMSLTIMQSSQELQLGEAYLVHPIPAQLQNAKCKAPPLSLSKSKLAALSGSASPSRNLKSDQSPRQSPKGDSKLQQMMLTRAKSFKLVASILLKSGSKVGDSGDTVNSDEARTALLDQGHGSGGLVAEAVELQPAEEGDDDEEIDMLQLKMSLGWKPALASIPESPRGYHPPELSNAPKLLTL